jgi:hypothetical protein
VLCQLPSFGARASGGAELIHGSIVVLASNIIDGFARWQRAPRDPGCSSERKQANSPTIIAAAKRENHLYDSGLRLVQEEFSFDFERFGSI